MQNTLVEPYDFPDTGRGHRALSDLEAGTTVLEVPLAQMLTNRDAETIFPGTGNLPEMASLSVYLSYQRYLGNASQYVSYLDTLPKDFNSWPCTFPSSLLEVLPIELKTRVLDQRKLAESHLSQVVELLNLDKQFKSFLRRDWVHSWLLVNSRCVTVNLPLDERGIRTKTALAPFFDIFNHAFNSGSKIDCDAASQKLKVVVGRDNKKDSQVFITYGPHDNEFLLVEYGFVIPGENPYDAVSLDLEFERTLFPGESEETRQRCFETLNEEFLFGDYQIGKNDISHRLTLALQLRAGLLKQKKGLDKNFVEVWRRRARGLEPLPNDGEVDRETGSLLKLLLDKALQRWSTDKERVESLNEPRLSSVVFICQTKCSIIENCLAYMSNIVSVPP